MLDTILKDIIYDIFYKENSNGKYMVIESENIKKSDLFKDMFLNCFICIFTFTNIILIYLEKLYTLALGINPGAVFWSLLSVYTVEICWYY